MLVRMRSSASRPGSMRASEPVARMTFFALSWAGFVTVHDFDGKHPILRRACELAISFYGFHLVLLHQELKALGVLGDDLPLALLDGSPVQLARVHALDPEFLGLFQMVPEFGIKQQSLGRDAADVQARAAQESVFFDERGFQAVLAGADRGGVSGRATANDGYVVNGFGQWNNPRFSVCRDDSGQTNDSRTRVAKRPNEALKPSSRRTQRLTKGAWSQKKAAFSGGLRDSVFKCLIVFVAGALPRDQLANRRTGTRHRLLVSFHFRA